MTPTLLCAALASLTGSALLTQSSPSDPAFEVASIKPNKSGSGNFSMHTSSGEIVMENVSLKNWIQRAFDVKDYSLSGPDWLDFETFDVIAKPPPGTPQDQYPAMLRSLLVDRFKLTFHRESKMLSAYALVVGKKGPKIHAVDGAGPNGSSSGKGRLTVHKLPMAAFADLLSHQLDRPVQDLTKLKGVFDFKLEYSPSDVVTYEDGQRPASADTAGLPSLFAAIQEQLGLRLQARKLPIQILAIDHVERVPTEN